MADPGEQDSTTVSFSYDADGNRTSTTVTSGSTTTTVKDVYQLGLIAYETDGAGTLLATFTYDSEGVPASVQVGSDPATAPRYYYVYNGHGDVVALVDAAGATVASYSYDDFGGITSSSESFANGWSNPYRYDGRDRVRYDAETGLYWMSVRAYDPTLGRFLSRDPLGRAPLFFADQPYVYAGNNPLVNVDPSGQLISRSSGAQSDAVERLMFRQQPRWHTVWGVPHKWWHSCSYSAYAQSHTCTVWRTWANRVTGRQQAIVSGMRAGAFGLYVGGVLLQIGGALWLLFNGTGDLTKIISSVQQVLGGIVKLVSGFSILAPDSHSPLLRVVTLVVDLVLAFVNSLGAMVARWGAGITRAFMTASEVAVEGEASPVMVLAEKLAGTALGWGLVAAGYAMDAAAQALALGAQHISSMSVDQFCNLPAACARLGNMPADGYYAY